MHSHAIADPSELRRGNSQPLRIMDVGASAVHVLVSLRPSKLNQDNFNFCQGNPARLHFCCFANELICELSSPNHGLVFFRFCSTSK
jgi:hypothetical protein